MSVTQELHALAGKRSAKRKQYLREEMPYAVVVIDGKPIVCNRRYELLKDWSRLKADAAGCIHGGKHGSGNLYLYMDGSAPWLSPDRLDAYLERLQRMFGQTTAVIPR